MELTPRIRAIREEQGIKQHELAEMVGISAPHLSQLERGVKNLNSRTLAKIADALGVDPSQLIAGETPPVWSSLMSEMERLDPADQERVRAFAESLRRSKDPV